MVAVRARLSRAGDAVRAASRQCRVAQLGPRSPTELQRRYRERLCGVVVGRLVDIANAHEHLQDRADEIECGLDLLVGSVSLNRRGDDNDAEAVSANGVCGRHHRDVDICTPRQKVPNGHTEVVKDLSLIHI